MMKKAPLLKVAALALGFWLVQSTAYACTDFQLTAKDGTVLVTRTLEFAQNMQSRLMSSPRGKLFSYTAPDGQPAMSWHSKYGYVLLDALNSGITMDGMNEQGLSFGYLYLPGETMYQTVPQGQDKNAMPYYAFGDWVLGNFTTVAQVKQALMKKYVYQQNLASFGKVIFPVHAVIHDATGHSIVVEFVKGKMNVYDNTIGVMTNSPTYDWQMTNLRNYLNLSPMAPRNVTVNGTTFATTGQGAGMVGLPGDATPPSRFVRTAILMNTSVPAMQASDLLNLAQHIVNNVDIPLGTVRDKAGSQVELDYTQWAVFKDLTHKVIYYRSYQNPTLQYVSLSKVDFSPNAKVLSMPIKSAPMMSDATAQFLGSK